MNKLEPRVYLQSRNLEIMIANTPRKYLHLKTLTLTIAYLNKEVGKGLNTKKDKTDLFIYICLTNNCLEVY